MQSNPIEREAAPETRVVPPQNPAPVTTPHPHWRALWSVQVPAILTALMGLLNLWSAITPSLPQRAEILRQVLPFEVRHGSHLTTALAGFALLLLSQNLWRRKQTAWGLTLAALVISAGAHLLKGLDWEEATCALILAVWLWLARRQFHARSDAPSTRRGLQIMAAAFVFTLVYGTLGFYLLDREFRVNFDLPAALWQTVTMFTQFYDPGLEPITRYGRYFADSIYGVALVTFGTAIWMLARPVISRAPSNAAERERVEAIVQEHGRTALAFCALFNDKIYWFSPGGSVISYAVVGRIAVALGDPIGPTSDAREAIAGWVAFCARNDWRPAFYEIYNEFLNDYHAAGLETLRIAHEAVVDVRSFSLDGKSNKNMRNAINGLKKNGHRAQLHPAPLSDAFLEEIREVSNEWLAKMNGSEKQFSLGWFDDDTIRNCPILAIHDAGGLVTAFANIVSCYNLKEGNIDLMRRRPETVKGTMELLFVSLFEWSKEQGFDTFNLGPSPFAMVGEHSEDPATEKALHFIYEHINQFYNFKGLHAFKEKFHPQWRPVFLAYAGKAGLPAIAAAVIRADSGQDSWWDFLRHLRGDNSQDARALQNGAPDQSENVRDSEVVVGEQS